MTPRRTTNNSRNTSAADSESRCNFAAIRFVFGCHLPDCLHAFLVEFWCAIRLPLGLPPLVNFITHVICSTAQEQMARINAFRIVALVKNADAAFNASIMQHPRNAIAKLGTFSSGPVKLTVAGIGGCPPHPTFSKRGNMPWNWPIFVHLLPKSLLGGFKALLSNGNFSHVHIMTTEPQPVN